MATVQATNMGGKIIDRARWRVKSLENVSVGEVLRINVPFQDDKLTKYLARIQGKVNECTLEKEESGSSVTIGLMVEKITHLLDDGAEEPDIESMAWIIPANRTVEAVLCFLMDRENCDPRFLTTVGATRQAEEKEKESGTGD